MRNRLCAALALTLLLTACGQQGGGPEDTPEPSASAAPETDAPAPVVWRMAREEDTWFSGDEVISRSWIEHTYTETGNLQRTVSCDPDGVENVDCECQYDAAGNLVSRTENGGLRMEYRYDGHGNRIEALTYRDDALIHREEYTYDEKARQTGSTWSSETDEADRGRTQCIYIDWEDGGWTAITQDRSGLEDMLLYTQIEQYNAEGDLIRREEHDPIIPYWSIMEYTYGETAAGERERVRSVETTCTGELSPDVILREYAGGQMVHRLARYIDGTFQERTCQYNENGDLLSERRWDETGTTDRFEYGYDEHGSLVSYTSYDAQGNVDEETRKSYTYDEQGNQLSDVGYESDGETEAYRLDSAYDAKGRITREAYTEGGGLKWVQTCAYTDETDGGYTVEETHTSYQSGKETARSSSTVRYDAYGNEVYNSYCDPAENLRGTMEYQYVSFPAEMAENWEDLP